MPRQRRLNVIRAAIALVLLSAGCLSTAEPGQVSGNVRLEARPSAPSSTVEPGTHGLGLGRGARDGFLYVPAGHAPDAAAPLLVLLHGAGRSAQEMLAFTALADSFGVVLLLPDSRLSSWDMMRGGFGPDVEFIDRALELTFGRVAVDPSRIAIGGFSDGASYALSLGIPNGDLFTHIVAFSPGYMEVLEERGKPRIFVSHGTADNVLGIEGSSRRIVPALRDAGYDVRYEEFDGGHTIPAAIAEQALEWFTQGPATGSLP